MEEVLSYACHIREGQWSRIKGSLPGKTGDPGRSSPDNRRFVEGVIWIGRNGARWRSLSSEYGN